MRVIVVGNQKGGVGKSTIACNLAVCFALNGNKVLLIDTDIQQSSMNFRALREKDDIQGISITKPTLYKDITNFTNFDIIIVDAGGRDTSVFRSAILSASNGLLIIPTLPSVYDIWATEDTLKVLSEARAFVDIPAFFLLNQIIRAKIVKEAEESLIELSKNYEVELLNSKLVSRVVYRNSIKEGKGVLEMEDLKAKEEMQNLFKEIKEKLLI